MPKVVQKATILEKRPPQDDISFDFEPDLRKRILIDGNSMTIAPETAENQHSQTDELDFLRCPHTFQMMRKTKMLLGQEFKIEKYFLGSVLAEAKK